MPFKFDLTETVKIKCSEEIGEVIGRAEHTGSENQYQLRYMAAHGRAVEQWWGESALVKP